MVMPVKRLFWLAGLFLTLALLVLWLATEGQSVRVDGGVLARLRTVIQGKEPPSSISAGRQMDASTVDFSPPPGAAKTTSPSISPSSPGLQNAGSAKAGAGGAPESPDTRDASSGSTLPRSVTASPAAATGRAQTKTRGLASPTITPQPGLPAPGNTTVDFETPPGVGSTRGAR